MGDCVGGPSAAEDGQVGFSDAAGVVGKVDRDDLRAGDRELCEGDRPPVRGRDDAGGSVDQCGQGDLGDSREGERASGHRRRTADRLAAWGYPKTKLQAEQIVANSGLPWTILRVTQFYDYCLTNAQKLSRFPVAPVPAGFTVQPVDPRDVAGRLVELALGEPVGRAPDMAGPQVSNWTDLLRGYLKASHRRRWVLPVRIPGTRAVRNGALLPPPGHTVGSRTWDQFLTTQLRQQATTTA